MCAERAELSKDCATLPSAISGVVRDLNCLKMFEQRHHCGSLESCIIGWKIRLNGVRKDLPAKTQWYHNDFNAARRVLGLSRELFPSQDTAPRFAMPLIISIKPIVNQIFHSDIISLVGSYLDDLDLISLCIAHTPLQYIFRTRLTTSPLQNRPNAWFESNITEGERLLDLLEESAKDNMSVIHNVPKEISIEASQFFEPHLQQFGSDSISFDHEETGPQEESSPLADDFFELKLLTLYSRLVSVCPNIITLTFDGGDMSYNGCRYNFAYKSACSPEGIVQGCRHIRGCLYFRLHEFLQAFPPLPGIKRLCLENYISPLIQRYISIIVWSSPLHLLQLINTQETLIYNVMRLTMTNKPLISLMVKGQTNRVEVSAVVHELLRSVPSIHCLFIDDNFGPIHGLHLLDYICKIRSNFVTVFAYEGNFYRRLKYREPSRRDYHVRFMPELFELYTSLDQCQPFKNFFAANSGLKYVRLTSCDFLDDPFFVNAWEALPHVQELLIHDSTEFVGDSLSVAPGAGWTQLRRLELPSCTKLTAKCMRITAATTTAEDVCLVFGINDANKSPAFQEDMAAFGYDKVHISSSFRTITFIKGSMRNTHILDTETQDLMEKYY